MPTVKHGGGKIQVRNCFSYDGVDPMKCIMGNMNGPMYRSILKTYMHPYLKELKREKNVNFFSAW